MEDPRAEEPQPRRSFADYRRDAIEWITTASGNYYPDVIEAAESLYAPVLSKFGQLLEASDTSADLLRNIVSVRGPMRTQLLRVFHRYVSHETTVEMLKRKGKIEETIHDFGHRFRGIDAVKAAFQARPIPDAPICVLLWEYKDRGKKGYELTGLFFEEFEMLFPDLTIRGPRRAGRDVFMGTVFRDYPYPRQPVDFVITEGDIVLAIGLARYDQDRGGSQEDDRTSGYRNTARTILDYCETHGLRTKVMFLNDGPGLLLGSMWSDYAELEESVPGKIMVFTLRMLRARVTLDWLHS